MKDRTKLSPPSKGAPLEGGLLPAMTFDNFVRGKANGLALHSARQFAEDDSTNGRHLLIYGGTGLGKTHLLHAIGNRFCANNPEAKVSYIRGSQFVSMVVSAFQRKNLAQFRNFFAELDLLLFDDVQLLAHKPGSQAELVEILEHYGEGKQKVVFACDGRPNKAFSEEPRLASRLSNGLIVRIDPPRRTLRLGILRQASCEMGMVMEEAAIRYMAEHDWSNVIELQSGLRRVAAYSSFHERSVNVKVVKAALRN